MSCTFFYLIIFQISAMFGTMGCNTVAPVPYSCLTSALRPALRQLERLHSLNASNLETDSLEVTREGEIPFSSVMSLLSLRCEKKCQLSQAKYVDSCSAVSVILCPSPERPSTMELEKGHTDGVVKDKGTAAAFPSYTLSWSWFSF